MPSPFLWFAFANAALWLGIGGYLALLANKQKTLAKRLHLLD